MSPFVLNVIFFNHPNFRYNGIMLVKISLVSLFNGTSNFVVYLMPKISLLKNRCGTIQPIAEEYLS